MYHLIDDDQLDAEDEEPREGPQRIHEMPDPVFALFDAGLFDTPDQAAKGEA